MAISVENAKKSTRIELILILVILFLILCIFFLMFPPGLFSKQEQGPPGDPSNPQIFTMCKDLVGKQLVAPTTAKWPHSWEVRIGKLSSPNTYRVLGYVDAQNSFGAMVRTHYTCDLQYLGGEWTDWMNWRLLTLEFD